MTVDLASLGAWVPAVLVGLLAWFMRRAAMQLDESLKSALAKLDEIEKSIHSHTLEIALLTANQKRIEDELGHNRILLDDMRGFLARQGFQKRETSGSQGS